MIIISIVKGFIVTKNLLFRENALEYLLNYYSSLCVRAKTKVYIFQKGREAQTNYKFVSVLLSLSDIYI